MSLFNTPDLRRFREEVRDFLQTHLSEELRQETRGGLHMAREDMARWQAILHRRGWGAPHWPQALGGTGWTALQRYIFEEESAFADAPLGDVHGLFLAGPMLIAEGSDAQKARYLPRILAGEEFWCQGFRTQCRVGPGFPQDTRAFRWHPLGHRWPEDLAVQRPSRRPDVLPGAHRARGQATGRPVGVHPRHARSRHHAAADPDDGRGPQRERRVLRQRARAGRRDDRCPEQGLGLCQGPARTRAREQRPGAAHQARHRRARPAGARVPRRRWQAPHRASRRAAQAGRC